MGGTVVGVTSPGEWMVRMDGCPTPAMGALDEQSRFKLSGRVAGRCTLTLVRNGDPSVVASTTVDITAAGATDIVLRAP